MSSGAKASRPRTASSSRTPTFSVAGTTACRTGSRSTVIQMFSADKTTGDRTVGSSLAAPMSSADRTAGRLASTPGDKRCGDEQAKAKDVRRGHRRRKTLRQAGCDDPKQPLRAAAYPCVPGALRRGEGTLTVVPLADWILANSLRAAGRVPATKLDQNSRRSRPESTRASRRRRLTLGSCPRRPCLTKSHPGNGELRGLSVAYS